MSQIAVVSDFRVEYRLTRVRVYVAFAVDNNIDVVWTDRNVIFAYTSRAGHPLPARVSSREKNRLTVASTVPGRSGKS